MAVNEIDGITNNPRFQELVRERSSFAWTLTIVMLVIYYGFILLVAFGKGFLATKIGDGVTSVGIMHRPRRHHLGLRPDRHLHPPGEQPTSTN